MNILLVGGGAREHAIAKALKRSANNPTLYCYATHYNPGIVPLCAKYTIGDLKNMNDILFFAKESAVTFAVIGPEAPLEHGVADILIAHDIQTIGPKRVLAQLETSKAFMRHLLNEHQISGSIPYRVFDSLQGVREFLKTLGENNYVIKANGLMSGKGVKVAGDHLHSFDEAYDFCAYLHQQGQSFVIEKKIMGQEFSQLYFCDGQRLIPMPLVQDHKRAYIGDKGPNTGGMGSYSDANHRLPFLTEADIQTAHQIAKNTLQALQAACGETYQGILYASFMATEKSVHLIEYNVRFGDPEAINVLGLLESDLVDIFQKILAGCLTEQDVIFSKMATVCKYAVPEGYPDHPLQNIVVDISHVKNPEQLYFGAIEQRDNHLYATGSRTIAVLGIGQTLKEAEVKAEAEINLIKGQLYHRPDIGTPVLLAKKIHEMQVLRQ